MPENFASCRVVGPLEFQYQYSASKHGGGEDICRFGNQNDRHRRRIERELIKLLDEDINAGAVFVMRLHLTPSRSKIVRLVDDQDATASAGRLHAGLRKR